MESKRLNKCSLCGSEGTNKSTCPLNEAAFNTDLEAHHYADPSYKKKQFVEALSKYVNIHECDEDGIQLIQSHITQHMPMTLYRGHSADAQYIKADVPWFSTSKSKRIAREEFTDLDCCIFIIHIDNTVPHLDVNDFLIGHNKGHEKEVIVLGGGTFYKSPNHDVRGFLDLGKISGKREFETWYTFEQHKTNDIPIERVMARIPVEEYEFIESPEDITMDIPDDQKQQAFRMIEEYKANHS